MRLRNDHALVPAPGEHSIETHLRAGAAVGAAGAGSAMELHFPLEVSDAVGTKLSEFEIGATDRVVGIHAGWGSRRQDPDDTRLRSWPAERFAGLIQRISRRYDAKILLTEHFSTGYERTIIARAGVSAVNSAGRFSLLESAALIRRLVRNHYRQRPRPHRRRGRHASRNPWGPGIFTATRPMPERTGQDLILAAGMRSCYGTSHMKTCTNNICMKDLNVDQAEAALAEIFE